MINRAPYWSGIALLLLQVPTSNAHHSFFAFDMTQTTDLAGTVKEFRWTNPHSWLVIYTKDASGRMVEASFEGNGPGYLVREGWTRDSLAPGDQVTIIAHPLRDGTLGGTLIKVRFPDGRELAAMGSPPPGFTSPGPVDKHAGADNAK